MNIRIVEDTDPTKKIDGIALYREGKVYASGKLQVLIPNKPSPKTKDDYDWVDIEIVDTDL